MLSACEALQALAIETQRDVTGVVHLKLYKGNLFEAVYFFLLIGALRIFMGPLSVSSDKTAGSI
jgi:hypothetical protein